MLGPMGSNLQRILGVMTPDSVKKMVETANVPREAIVSKVDTSTEDQASKKNQEFYQDSKQDTKNDEHTNFLETINNTASSKSLKEKKQKFQPSQVHSDLYESNVIPFNKEITQANNKKIKQRVAISSYQKNIVPNYLKGTKRNDLQGLLVNKKCG